MGCCNLLLVLLLLLLPLLMLLLLVLLALLVLYGQLAWCLCWAWVVLRLNFLLSCLGLGQLAQTRSSLLHRGHGIRRGSKPPTFAALA